MTPTTGEAMPTIALETSMSIGWSIGGEWLSTAGFAVEVNQKSVDAVPAV